MVIFVYYIIIAIIFYYLNDFVIILHPKKHYNSGKSFVNIKNNIGPSTDP